MITEQEWLTCCEPMRLYDHLFPFPRTYQKKPSTPLASDRKLHLFAAACCREFWNLLNEGSRNAVEVVEQYAEGPTRTPTGWRFRSGVEARTALVVARRDWLSGTINSSIPDLARMSPCSEDAAVAAFHAIYKQDIPRAADLLRCLIGNPFNPGTLPREMCRQCRGAGHVPNKPHLSRHLDCPGCQGKGQVGSCPLLTWHDGLVVQTADSIYQQRCWEDLPILADALEEAGLTALPCSKCNGKGSRVTGYKCDMQGKHPLAIKACLACQRTGRVPHPLLAHLRGASPHARGCWVLDLLTGRS